MKDIAERADVALATLYRYFPSKQWIVLAVNVHRMRDLLARARLEGELAGDTVGRLAILLLRHLRAELRRPHYTIAVRQAVLGATIEQRRLVDEMTASLHDSMVIGVGALSESQIATLGPILTMADAAAGAAIAGARRGFRFE